MAERMLAIHGHGVTTCYPVRRDNVCLLIVLIAFALLDSIVTLRVSISVGARDSGVRDHATTTVDTHGGVINRGIVHSYSARGCDMKPDHNHGDRLFRV